MDLFESISRRKSCRKYTDQCFDTNRLNEIEQAIKGFEPLYKDVPLSCRFVTETKGLYHVKAPHYLIISGNGNEREKENAGFLYEQLVLWFDANDIGCVWLGEAKDIQKNKNGKDIITIAFGEAIGSVHRSESEFKRKPISEIANVAEDPCIHAVHLAPSGMNLQPWYFEKSGDKVLVYQQKLKTPVSLVYKKVELDMGIALCHYALGCKHTGKSFAFEKKEDLPEKKGYYPFGEIK